MKEKKQLVEKDKQTSQASEAGKNLKKKLQADFPNLWDKAAAADRELVMSFAEEYKQFITLAKTEREFVTVAVETLENMGFVTLESLDALPAGSKVYTSIRGKGLVAAVIGSKPAAGGFNLVGAHIDAPRLDLKPLPVYEDNELVYAKTHYYGGIKKYQWPAVPLALHGIIFKADGSPLTVNIGESPDDPVLTITDLLPHLGTEQMGRNAREVIRGEEMNILLGGMPYPDAELSGRFKLGILQWLQEHYGLAEKDFVSAELEVVPAGPARDVGLDGSMIGAYGQDDRVCAFPALVALTSIEKPERTVACLLFDKEETGSEGNTGAQSRAYEYALQEIFERSSEPGQSNLAFARMLSRCQMLSADVSAAFDPTFASVYDARNSSFLGHGLSMLKYVGSRGKSGTSDANGEFFSRIIRLFQAEQIPWQTGELGKVDAGGGGTIAMYLANLGMEVIDCGVPVLSMHSPFEITSKIDLYYTYLAYRAFLEHLS
ncbi:MAG: aminopeptidase [Clostridiaceae bacterium]|nr:aminopeptidase [Clostridiaceae bacterium]